MHQSCFDPKEGDADIAVVLFLISQITTAFLKVSPGVAIAKDHLESYSFKNNTISRTC